MSLPDERVLGLLREHYVVGWSNIYKAPYVGYSAGYSPKQSAVDTTNGAGAHNLQLLVLGPDRTVVHALAGYWAPEDLAHELEFARVLWRLWRDDQRSVEEKRRWARLLQLQESRRERWRRGGRNEWQGFDAVAERARLASEERDTFAAATPRRGRRLKSPAVVQHERLAARPFVRLADFDLRGFVDYGRHHYDLNARVDEAGRHLPGQDRIRARRAVLEQRAARAAKKRTKARR
ncbi:MAG: hypothetical protein AAF628_02490 [Planctomycetota bacterium]